MNNFKLTALALCVASTSTFAATNVTLYGTAEIAYRDGSGTKLYQDAGGESRVGFKGNEDLGNGTSAFFQLESRYNLDTGANAGQTGGTGFFDEKSVVGLGFANGMHKVYFGKSTAPIDRLGNDIGHLSTGQSTHSSMGGWRNSAFYDFSANGLTVATAISTKGGAFAPNATTTESTTGAKSSYGISARYDTAKWYAGAGWQADNDNKSADSNVKSEWKMVGGMTFNPVSVGVSYANATRYTAGKRKIMQANISGNLTANDALYATFGRYTGTSTAGADTEKTTKWGFGYRHSFSARTSAFAGYARSSDSIADASTNGYDVGLKHTF